MCKQQSVKPQLTLVWWARVSQIQRKLSFLSFTSAFTSLSTHSISDSVHTQHMIECTHKKDLVNFICTHDWTIPHTFPTCQYLWLKSKHKQFKCTSTSLPSQVRNKQTGKNMWFCPFAVQREDKNFQRGDMRLTLPTDTAQVQSSCTAWSGTLHSFLLVDVAFCVNTGCDVQTEWRRLKKRCLTRLLFSPKSIFMFSLAPVFFFFFFYFFFFVSCLLIAGFSLLLPSSSQFCFSSMGRHWGGVCRVS